MKARMHSLSNVSVSTIVEEVSYVIRALTQSSPDFQRKAIDTYFTDDASFIHPFCRVGSFEHSRWLIGRIYRWYKIMSPRIDLTINSIGLSLEHVRPASLSL